MAMAMGMYFVKKTFSFKVSARLGWGGCVEGTGGRRREEGQITLHQHQHQHLTCTAATLVTSSQAP